MGKPKGVLAFDPGSQLTGWCLTVGGVVEASGAIQLNHKWGFEERRSELREKVAELIVKYARRIDLVIVEEPLSANIGVSKKLSTIKAMIEEIAFREKCFYVSILPHEWHKLARSNGLFPTNTPIKTISRNLAALALGKNPDTQDEADAYWIARWAEENVTIEE